MSAIHISVIIPAYNEHNFLPACLDALCIQTVQPDVVYVVDNNSTDDTADLARAYPFVELLHEPTQGICAATKTGLDAATSNGGIILRCDADSRPAPDWVETITVLLQHNPHAVAATGPGVTYDCSRLLQWIVEHTYMRPYFRLVGLALGQRPLFGSNCALRASAWKRIRSTTHLNALQNIHDDIDLSYHLVPLGAIVYDNNLRMPISARPFRSIKGMSARFVIGFRSIFIHWPEQAPWRKYMHR